MREVAALAILLAACSKESPRARCDRMLSRYAKLVAAEGAADPGPIRAVLTSDEGLRRCEVDYTEARYACAMAAPSADAFEQCLE
jgi:hypothetical protein